MTVAASPPRPDVCAPPELIILPARASDVGELHAVVERAYRGESARAGWTHEADLLSGPRTDEATLLAIVGREDQRLLVAREGGAIVGCVQVTRLDGGRAYLGLLSVEPGRQAGGLGKTLARAAEAEAAAAFGATVMELSVISTRRELIAYYRRRGYAPTGEIRPLPVAVTPALEMVVMAKPIPAADAD